jgi:hypothetical protein
MQMSEEALPSHSVTVQSRSEYENPVLTRVDISCKSRSWVDPKTNVPSCSSAWPLLSSEVDGAAAHV